MIIKPEPLIPSAFEPFGQVIDTDSVEPELINGGNTKKFADLARLTIAGEGRTQLCIYRSKPIDLPFRIRMLEQHPLGSQAFYPLHGRPFPVVVATAGRTPGAQNIRVFLTNGRQGVNLNAGVWHHYQLSLQQVSDYIVIDRKGAADNCQEHVLEEQILLHL